LWRERSGRGQYIDASLLDVQVSALANIASNYLVAGKEAQRWGTAHESIIPYQVFNTKDRPIAIAVANQKLWVNFCKLVGKSEWVNDPRFESNPKRVENRKEMLPLVAEVMATKTCDEWVELFVAGSIPCGPVNNMENLFSDPQVLHRNMVADVPHPTIGKLRLCGTPIKYAETPATIRRPPPTLGQHTDEILVEVLDYSSNTIEALRDEGTI
jgi:formyl-CoA transferase